METKQYIDDLISKWTSYRQGNFESKWTDNFNQFNGIEDIDLSINKEAWQSKSFIGLTRTKTTAAVSLVLDNLLQKGSFPFTMTLSASDEARLRHAPSEQRDDAMTKIFAINKTMQNQMAKSNITEELYRIATYSATYGDAWARFVINDDGLPSLRSISGWNFLTDWRADIGSGIGSIHRSFLTEPDVIDFFTSIDMDFDEKELAKALVNPTATTSKINTMQSSDDLDGMNELLECFVRAPVSTEVEDGQLPEYENIVAYILNDVLVGKISVEKMHPFYHVEWQKAIDVTANISVPDNVRDMQLVMNKAFRGFEDNKYLSGNVWGCIRPDLLDVESSAGMLDTPGKFFPVADTVTDVRQAIMQVQISDVGRGYLDVIQTADRMADEHSMIPKIAHGAQQSGQKTAYQSSQEIDKAGKYIAGVIRNFDFGLIEPFVEDSYQWNSTSQSDESFDGSLQCTALGYESYNDKVVKSAALQGFLQMAMSNERFLGAFSVPRIAEMIGPTLGIDAIGLLKTPSEKKEESAAKEKEGQERQQERKHQQEIAERQLQAQEDMQDATIEGLQLENAIKEGQYSLASQKLSIEVSRAELEAEKIGAEIEKIKIETDLASRAQNLDESKSEHDMAEAVLKRRAEQRKLESDIRSSGQK